jgi:hypothetical protein
VFFAHLRAPEDQTLTQLDAHLRRYQQEPVERFGLFRRVLAISRLPRPLRRVMWWVGLNASRYKRARRKGTFGISAYEHRVMDGATQARALARLEELGPARGALQRAGFRVYCHRLVPTNDGGLSLGQLAVAAACGLKTVTTTSVLEGAPNRVPCPSITSDQ